MKKLKAEPILKEFYKAMSGFVLARYLKLWNKLDEYDLDVKIIKEILAERNK